MMRERLSQRMMKEKLSKDDHREAFFQRKMKQKL